MSAVTELCVDEVLAQYEADFEPHVLGPTWQRDAEGEFILPEYTLGWQILKWIEDNLLDDEGGPFKPTPEQGRFILWWYAIDEDGRFLHREGVLQRLKGWGKDPVATVLAAVECFGPCRFAGWATVDMPDKDIVAGDPVGKRHMRAWVQVAAVSQEQTKNTMALFHGLFTPACIKEHAIDLGKTVIYGYGGQVRIEAVTSSWRSMEGNRPTFVIRNETHHWLSNNEGHDMAGVIERNLTKAKDGSARSLSITNAYEPSEDSVAQRQREAYDREAAGLAVSTGVMYDSLEASKTAKLRPPNHLDENGKPTISPSEAEVKGYLARVLESVRGDAKWLDIKGLVNSILDTKNPPSRSRRFWFNQVVAAEDAWVHPDAVELAVDPIVAGYRLNATDPLRAGWEVVLPDEEIVMFGDGSKSDDATALVGCRLSDGYCFLIGVWQKPRGERGEKWLVPRNAVDNRVREAKRRFNVVGFWFDPSHARDDVEGTRYWDSLIHEWHQEFKESLQLWVTKSGHNAHSVMFDMTSPERTRMFVGAAEKVQEEFETRNDVEEFAPEISIDGHPALLDHLKNAKANPGKYGVSLMKEHRESDKKIDAGVCLVGARMMRDIIQNQGLDEEDQFANGAEIWY